MRCFRAARTLSLLLLPMLAACVEEPSDGGQGEFSPSSEPTRSDPSAPFLISSPAFTAAGAIPRKHTCDADNVSPPLSFKNAPGNATGVALIMEDPDAPSGTVLHWTFWNLPINVTDLPEKADLDSSGAREGREYRGPCPPVGTHRYFFYAYATDRALDLQAGASVSELRSALRGHVASEAQVYGTYTRPQLPTGA